jgi:TIR domain
VVDGRGQPPEIFISYAHEDANLKRTLLEHMSGIRKRGIKVWDDGLIVPGQEWDNEIQAHLMSSSVILLLISSSFLNSDYIDRVEMLAAFARHEKGEASVVSILLRPVDLEGFDAIKRLQILPDGGKPVVEWGVAKGFTNVVKGINRVLRELGLAGVDFASGDNGEEIWRQTQRNPVSNDQEAGIRTQGNPSGTNGGETARVSQTNRTRSDMGPDKVALLLERSRLEKLQANQAELESYVRFYIGLESSGRTVKLRDLVVSVRDYDERAAQQGSRAFWGSVEERLNEIRPLETVARPPAELREKTATLDAILEEANALVGRIQDSKPDGADERASLTSDFLSRLRSLRDDSTDMLDMCRTEAESVLHDLIVLLEIIFGNVPQDVAGTSRPWTSSRAHDAKFTRAPQDASGVTAMRRQSNDLQQAGLTRGSTS